MASKRVRLPAIAQYNSRMSAAGSQATSTAYAGVGVAGLMVAGRTVTATSKDARYVNCFAQTVTDEIANSKRVYAVKRPGFGTQSTPESGSTGHAVIVWSGKGDGTDVISAFGSTNSNIYNGSTSLGAITGKCTGISETVLTTTATLVITSSDSTAWYYDTGVGTTTKITDVDFPGNASETIVGTFAHIDGYACVMTQSGQLWASDINSVTAWTASSYASTSAYPDKGVGCVRNKNFIMAFGTESVEFWYNAGLSPFPLTRATALTLKVGAISADAIGEISDTTFWVGSTPQGGLSVFQYDGTLRRVSNPEQDAALLLAGASNITLTTIRFFGRSFVLVIAGTSTYAYCVEEKFWHEWSTTTVLWTKCTGVSIGSTMVNYAVSDQSTSGKVYLMNNASLVFTDDAVAYTARIQLPSMDLNTNRKKFWESVEIVGDQEESTSSLSLLYTDDDYQNYTTASSIDLSSTDRRISRLGASRKRGWVMTHAANTPMRIEALELMVEVGSV